MCIALAGGGVGAAMGVANGDSEREESTGNTAFLLVSAGFGGALLCLALLASLHEPLPNQVIGLPRRVALRVLVGVLLVAAPPFVAAHRVSAETLVLMCALCALGLTAVLAVEKIGARVPPALEQEHRINH